jgi:hypothetical protein
MALSLTPLAAAHRTNPGFDPPKQYYLALGDSLPYGFQQVKFDVGLSPSAFNTGYVDVFAARLRELRPNISVVNFGCPGETTTSFVAAPCFFTTLGGALHDPFTGSQLTAAVAFLRAHRGQVSPITLNLWGNDLSVFVFQTCQFDFACIQAGEQKTGALRMVRVLKFKVGPQQLLLAHTFHAKRNVVEVLAVGPHENFYRDLQEYLDAR